MPSIWSALILNSNQKILSTNNITNGLYESNIDSIKLRQIAKLESRFQLLIAMACKTIITVLLTSSVLTIFLFDACSCILSNLHKIVAVLLPLCGKPCTCEEMKLWHTHGIQPTNWQYFHVNNFFKSFLTTVLQTTSNFWQSAATVLRTHRQVYADCGNRERRHPVSLIEAIIQIYLNLYLSDLQLAIVKAQSSNSEWLRWINWRLITRRHLR